MYLELLKQILSIVNRANDLNGNNIVEKIKEELKKKRTPCLSRLGEERF